MLPTDAGAGNRVRNKTYQMRALFNITGACSVLLAMTKGGVEVTLKAVSFAQLLIKSKG